MVSVLVILASRLPRSPKNVKDSEKMSQDPPKNQCGFIHIKGTKSSVSLDNPYNID